MLEPHGGGLNGFFLIQGKAGKLDSMVGSPEWAQHQVRASMHLTGLTLLRGLTNTAVMERMGMWTQSIPR